MTEHKIKACKLIIEWADGLTENLSPDLPEYLTNEIEAYLDELEDLRTEQQQEYNISEATE
jgi:predicted DNA-binding protein